MDKLKKPPVPAAPVRKRKKGSESGPGAAAAAAATSPPPAAKKARVAAPKAKASKAGLAQQDAAEPSAREDARGGDAPEEERLGKSKLHTGVFSKDLPWLMFGFGDADKPLKESVDLVEEIAMQYITDTVHTAMRAAAARSAATTAAAAARKDELKLEDVLFAVRKDPRKVARIQELIRRQQDIENAKRLIKADDDMPTEL